MQVQAKMMKPMKVTPSVGLGPGLLSGCGRCALRRAYRKPKTETGLVMSESRRAQPRVRRGLRMSREVQGRRLSVVILG